MRYPLQHPKISTATSYNIYYNMTIQCFPATTFASLQPPVAARNARRSKLLQRPARLTLVGEWRPGWGKARGSDGSAPPSRAHHGCCSELLRRPMQRKLSGAAAGAAHPPWGVAASAGCTRCSSLHSSRRGGPWEAGTRAHERWTRPICSNTTFGPASGKNRGIPTNHFCSSGILFTGEKKLDLRACINERRRPLMQAEKTSEPLPHPYIEAL